MSDFRLHNQQLLSYSVRLVSFHSFHYAHHDCVNTFAEQKLYGQILQVPVVPREIVLVHQVIDSIQFIAENLLFFGRREALIKVHMHKQDMPDQTATLVRIRCGLIPVVGIFIYGLTHPASMLEAMEHPVFLQMILKVMHVSLTVILSPER